MKILFKMSIVLSLFSTLLFTSGFSTSNDSVQFIKTNWVENSEGVIIVNSHKELLEYYNVNLKKFSLGPREKIASDSTIGFANAIEKYDEEYFRNSSIIIAILEENSGSYRHKYDGYSVNKIGTLTVNIKTTCDSDYATCDMAGWHVIIETNKLDNIKETKLCKTGLHQ